MQGELISLSLEVLYPLLLLIVIAELSIDTINQKKKGSVRPLITLRVVV